MESTATFEDIIIEETKKFVRKTLEKAESGHDWWHILRVYNNAMNIAKKEKCNKFVVALGALLHDIADWKFSGSDEEGPKVTREFLTTLKVDEKTIDEVSYIVKNVSFKGAKAKDGMESLEGKIVQDADRLDAIGAIGIARTFSYGGHRNRTMYDPDEKPTLHESFEAYKKNEGTTINHFYEKLLLLKDRMHTESAKAIAEERHRYMEEYLKRFYGEWNGEC